MASGTEGAVGELSLCEFARANRGSTRLRNSLEAAETGGSLPFRTVREYLASPAPAEVLRMRVRSMGRRTVLELDRMVRDFRSPGDPVDGDVPDPGEVGVAVSAMRDRLAVITIRSLLRHLPSGTRISRIVDSDVGGWPVLEAAGEPDRLRADALRVPAVGAGTIDGLIAEIRLCVSRLMREAGGSLAVHDAVLAELFGGDPGPTWRIDDPGPQAQMDARGLLLEALDGMDTASAFADAVVPVRLARLLVAPGVGQRPLADTLLARVRVGWELARVPNVGRKTIVEFWDVCWRRCAVALARRGASDAERAALAALLEVSPDRLDALPEDLASHDPMVASDGEEGAAVVVIPRDLDGLLGFLLERIRSQDAPVVRRRFGLCGGQGETLEEIGADLRVTRERVRQLEKRGMGDLGVIGRRVDLRGAVDGAWESAWEALADGDDLVTDHEFATFRRTVAGALRLALELLGLDLAAWLSDVSTRYPHGWLAPHRDPAPVDLAIAAIDALPGGMPLPRAISDLGLPGAPLDVA